MRVFEQPDAILAGAGKRTFDVAEKLTFQQIGRQRAAVHRYKRRILKWAAVVDSAGNALLAGAALALDEDGGRAVGDLLDLVTFYSENLAVPARRDVGDPQVLRGKELFHGIGCVGCHTPKYVTSRKAENKAHRFQLIWPYSDFLLHDMGEGLADGQQVGIATGSEWRTPPLWGIGLTETVSGHTFFLHDGRARNLEEAILWHGGEGQVSRDAYAGLEAEDRAALIRFLESL